MSIDPLKDLTINFFPGTDVPYIPGPVPGALSSIQSASIINSQGTREALLAEEAISVLDFARLINGSLDQLKQALNESEILDIRSLQRLSEALLNQLIALEEKQKKLREYYDTLTELYETRDGYVEDINTAVDTYNQKYEDFQQKLSDLNNAADALNALSGADPNSPEYQTALDNYNQAADAYNTARDTFNDAVTIYNSKVTEYSGRIDDVNNQLDDINELGAPFNIPPIAHFGVLVQSKNQVPAADNVPPAVVGSIPIIEDPGSETNTEPVSPTLDSFDTYSNTYLAAETQALNQALKASLEQRAALLRDLDNRLFYLKGVSLNPTIANAYTTRAPQIFVESATGQGAGTSLSTMLGGLSSPILERLVGYGLVTSTLDDDTIRNNKELSDQLVAFNLSLYNPISLKGGTYAAGLLADVLGTAPLNGTTTGAAVAAGFTRAANQFVESNEEGVTPKLSDFLQKNLGITAEIANELAAAIVIAFSITLLFNALSALGEALGIPDLAQRAVKELSQTSDLKVTDKKPTDAFNDTIQRLLLKSTLFEIGQTFFSNEKHASETINDAIDKVALKLGKDATESDIKAALQQEFLTRGLSTEQATLLSDNAVQFIRGDTALSLFNPNPTQGAGTTPPTTPVTPTATAPLPQEIRNQTIALLTPEIGVTAATNFAESLLPIVDPRFPHSAANLISLRLDNLRERVGEEKFNELKTHLEDVFSRHDDPVILLRRFLDPANTLLMSYMTGLMYDTDIPTNWQRPLNIQI